VKLSPLELLESDMKAVESQFLSLYKEDMKNILLSVPYKNIKKHEKIDALYVIRRLLSQWNYYFM
jgi:hypothetical protein